MFKRKPKVCEVCGIPAEDLLADWSKGGKSTRMCRDHVVEAFATAFLSFGHPMVVCEPHAAKYAERMYPYYPLARFPEFGFRGTRKRLSVSGRYDGSDEQIVSQWLVSIDESCCGECGLRASVRYFPEPAVRYDGNGPLFGRFDIAGASFWCAAHAVDTLRPIGPCRALGWRRDLREHAPMSDSARRLRPDHASPLPLRSARRRSWMRRS